MERQPVLGVPKASRVQPAPADDMPARPRLPLRLMAIGMVILIGSGIVVGVTINPLSQPAAPPKGANALRIAQRAVAVAYVDVKGGVINLSPTTPGRVRSLPVPEGKEVPEGTVLLQLDDDQAQIDLARAELDLEASQVLLTQALELEDQRTRQITGQEAAVKAAIAKETIAQLQSDKADRIKNINGGDEDLKTAKKQVELAAAGVIVERAKLETVRSMNPSLAIRRAKIEVENKKRMIAKAKLAVNDCQIKAPRKGMILRQLINLGELLGPTSPKPALQFCPAGDRIVRAEVEQEYAERVTMGQKAIIQDESTGKGEWSGEVIGVSEWYTGRRDIRLEPMQFNDSRTLEVIIRLDKKGADSLRINQRVRVKLDGAE